MCDRYGLFDTVCIAELCFCFVNSGLDDGAVSRVAEVSADQAVDLSHRGVVDIGFAQYVLAAVVVEKEPGFDGFRGLFGFFLAVAFACCVVGNHVVMRGGDVQAQGFLRLLGAAVGRMAAVRKAKVWGFMVFSLCWEGC